MVASQKLLAGAIAKSTFSPEILNKYDLDYVSSSISMSSRLDFSNTLATLLLKAIKGNEIYKQIYLDERLRFSPFSKSKETQCQYFIDIFKIESEALSYLDVTCRKNISRINEKLIYNNEEADSILLVGDCLMNEVRVFLPDALYKRSVFSNLDCQYFSGGDLSVEIEKTKVMFDSKKYAVIIVSIFSFTASNLFSKAIRSIDSISELEMNVAIDNLILEARKYILGVRSFTSSPILFHNVSGLPIGAKRRLNPLASSLSKKMKLFLKVLNSRIEKDLLGIENIILLDERRIALKYGEKSLSRSPIPKSMKKFVHTSYFGMHLATEHAYYLDQLSKVKGKKVICVDFDNTLWSGVMADGEVLHYHHKQLLLKELKELGILIVAVSKNHAENIRWEELSICKDVFSDIHINWNKKYLNIILVAKRMNLSLRNFIFVDDNKMELELVSKKIPELLCLDANDEETWATLKIMKKAECTASTYEAKRRTVMYQEQIERSVEIEAVDSDDAYQLLGLSIFFSKAKKSNLNRIEELINRTNQFNTTTTRYSRADLKTMLADPAFLFYTANLSDKFGDLGLVSVIIIEKLGLHCTISNFVMSCRAMGYEVEVSFMREVLLELRSLGVETVSGKIIPTNRNLPCRDIYKKLGFKKNNDEWCLELPNWSACDPIDWISFGVEG
ncbi:HAD-IIIC family phosphatase [Salinimonas sediminis]|nr:HAD-IIIC family phosphatase [Salinimonas sediminis]